MGAKKNNAKISRNYKTLYYRWQPINLPHEIFQLLNSYYSMSSIRRRGRLENPLHHMGYAIATAKTWVHATTRCSSRERRWPELHLSGNSSNTSSASTRWSEAFYMSKWIKCESQAIDPFGSKNKHIEFTQTIGFEGKIYALSLQGALAVIEETDSRLTITRMSSDRAVPSVDSRFFKECLVLMNEEILLVFFIHQKSLEIVDGVEVFRLCFANLKWIKAEGLQGNALFFEEMCYWVNSARIGCRGDCVYFTQGSDGRWWLYDMEKCCISPV